MAMGNAGAGAGNGGRAGPWRSGENLNADASTVEAFTRLTAKRSAKSEVALVGENHNMHKRPVGGLPARHAVAAGGCRTWQLYLMPVLPGLRAKPTASPGYDDRPSR